MKKNAISTRVKVGFALALLVQLAIMFGVPARNVYTLATGQQIMLRLAPVDPYDMWSGYFMTLRYDISRPDSLAGWAKIKEGEKVYVKLQKMPDQTMKAVSLTTQS